MKQYDLHIHTKCSSCSNQTIKQILDRAYSLKLDGIAITDHDQIKAAFEAKKMNKRKSFEVIIGEEITTDQGHVVGLFLNKQIKKGKALDVINEIHKQGGIAILAHPYSMYRNVLSHKVSKEVLQKVDALEVLNGREVFLFLNNKSLSLCKKYKKAHVAGSDGHFPFEVGSVITKCSGDLKKSIFQRKTSVSGRSKYAMVGHFMTLLRRIRLI